MYRLRGYLRLYFLLRQLKLRKKEAESLRAVVDEAKKGWKWWQPAIAVFLAIAAAIFVWDMLGRWLNRETSLQETTNAPVVEQAFDERLSLKMPVRFSPETDFPIQQLPKEDRGRVQKATQRTAYFNGVTVAVTHMVPIPGVLDAGEQYHNVQSALDGSFWAYHPDQTPPEINWGAHNEVYQSGAITYTIDIGGKPDQWTTVVIASKRGKGLWSIMASGSGEAAKIADETARNFVFR